MAKEIDRSATFKGEDLTGMIFGKLTVTGFAGSAINYNGRKMKMWDCSCSCGVKNVVHHTSLVHGNSKSCGCGQRESVANKNYKHGLSIRGNRHALYAVWNMMIQRCENSSNKDFHHYGARGISVCPSWKESFVNFVSDMPNWEKGLTIERKNNGGNYCKENCRWATQKEQTNNTRRNHMASLNGETMTISQWAEKLHINKSMLYCRFRKGWSDEMALTKPSRYASTA